MTLKTFKNNNLKETVSDQVNPEEKKFRETLRKSREFLNLAQKRDVSGQHSGRLMDFEAEIKIIAEKSEQPGTDYKQLYTQLMVILQTLRGLNF